MIAVPSCSDCKHSWAAHRDDPVPGCSVMNCPCAAPLSVGYVADVVNHPPHYTAHPSGVECIDVVEHMGFNLGNAIKYIWRCDLKGDEIEDLRKAAWYINREIDRRTRTRS